MPSEHDGTLVEILAECDCTRKEFMDKAFMDYKDQLKMRQVVRYSKLLRFFGNDIHIASINYTATDPDGKEFVASGIIAYPLNRRWKGTVEITPSMKSKEQVASKILVSVELVPALFGYVTIIPDMMGFGSAGNYPIDYMGFRRSVNYSASMRRASERYLRGQLSVGVPEKTIVFGYSLGAGGALALAKFYQDHPEEGVVVKETYCGGGLYNPGVAMKAMAERKEMDYMIAPQILLSCNWYNKLGVDFSRVFRGELLKNHQKDCDGVLHPYELTAKYGMDLTAYMHPDMFTEEMNPDIRLLFDALCRESMCFQWTPKFNLHLFHSSADAMAPVECTDALVANLVKSPHFKLKYHRTKMGTHYDTAIRTYGSLVKHIILR